jgi:transposase
VSNFSDLINSLNIDEASKLVMHKIINDLLHLVAEKDTVIKSQAEEILELQRQLNMDSSNSSKPPSTDANTKKKSNSNVDDKAGKGRRGGKFGHKGVTLNQIKKPDRINKIMLELCSCGSKDLRVTGRYESRQEFDIEIKRVITEYRLVQCKCGSCGKISKPESDIPKNAFYSERVKAYAVYMLDRHFMPYERLKEQFKDMLNLDISEGSISNWSREFAKQLGQSYLKKLKKLLLACKYIHADETGINVAGKNIWAHVNCTDKYTLLQASPKRGTVGITAGGILDKYTGFVIADGWSSYKGLSSIRGIQSCFAHLFRYCVDIGENYKQKWATKMLTFLHSFIASSKKLTASGIKNYSAKERIKYNIQYDKLLKEGELELKQHNYAKSHHTWRFLNRLRKEKSSVLRFLRHTMLPLTNNEAERSLRPLKIKQKISGTCLSLKTAQENLDIRSFIATAKKHGHNVLNAMLKLFKNADDFILT